MSTEEFVVRLGVGIVWAGAIVVSTVWWVATGKFRR